MEVEWRANDARGHSLLFSMKTQDAQYFAATVFQSGYLKGEDFMIYSPDSWSNSQAMQVRFMKLT